ncbi:MAG TPA: hypothetical protein VGL59_20350 [Polyangia bacterium]|jgi:hypothetical protein
MRFSLRRAMSISCSPVAFALLAMSLFGCENKHLGRPCNLGVTDDGGSSTAGANATISGEVLACPSRICILPAALLSTDDGAYCTAECSTDDDCSDGELNSGAADDKRCHHGFVCGVATEVGDFCCQKLCICRDFVLASGGQLPDPPSCKPGISTCKNVH